ncbi:MAG: sodium:proton exchanger [Candidatus Wallbacteria bacterium HGW-Wallbacteria-1]|jgi:cation:H+ antiporter|uniref:Sodium:proton exchanger n=1 Tax=Candidatus Wallbacteria bacterium HGW-Wallbacteria-1 TaxID=2013854 RepID=A0A2N1PN60_9BACT|nr:MAG: sodium:proton exchanger [Candidatus Wallbacteria bacterium HGW-Wallbacteria-1]
MTIKALVSIIVGFLLLVKAADWLVSASCSLARRLGIEDMIIGLTVVAFGTSMPEFMVNILSSLNGSSDIAIGNVLGSNICNILLILGLSALLFPLPVAKDTVIAEIPFSLTAALLLAFLVKFSFFQISFQNTNINGSQNILNAEDGILLLCFFLMFMAYIFFIAREKNESEILPDEIPLKKSVLMLITSLFGLYLGGEWVVRGAVEIARNMGLSESLIALTIVAIGTSLPELFTSVTAAAKGRTDLAVGNIVGSNIFNILWILGVSSLIRPLEFNLSSDFDMIMTVFASTLLLLALVLGRKMEIQRRDGLIFVSTYIWYIYRIILRG